VETNPLRANTVKEVSTPPATVPPTTPMTSLSIINRKQPKRKFKKPQEGDKKQYVPIFRYPIKSDPQLFIECLHIGETSNPYLIHIDHARKIGKKTGPFREEYLVNLIDGSVTHISTRELTVEAICKLNAPKNNKVVATYKQRESSEKDGKKS
jgi:hypothetical protein